MDTAVPVHLTEPEAKLFFKVLGKIVILHQLLCLCQSAFVDPAIKGDDFPGVFWPKHAGRYYVTVTVDGETQKTVASERDNAPRWNETFFFHGRVASMLKLRVFAERTYIKDNYIGKMEENIRSLFAQANVDRAVTRTLSKKDGKGALQPQQAGIKFNILEVKGGPECSTSAGEDCFGVHVLVPGVEPVEIDIVAIHGLDGHCKDSWTTKQGTLWLRDLLPEKLPHARVLTYGYDAYTRGRKQLANESIYDLAKGLLSSLALERQVTDTEKRPIIFVAHSLGGIVLKYALISANSASLSHNFHHKAVELSTYGILFLGTPHQGAHDIDLALLVLWIYSIYYETNDAVLKDLRLHSKALHQQLDLYAAISHKYVTKFYYEMYRTELFAGRSVQLVDQYSATIPGAQNAETVALKKDHVGIAKFDDLGDGDFKTVAGHIALMAKVAVSKIVERWEEHEGRKDTAVDHITSSTILNLLPYAEGASWHTENLQCLPGTRTVLLANIWTWITSINAKQPAEFFWLTSVAGAGKSVIANTIVRRCEEEGLLALSFFFDRDFPERKPKMLFPTIARNIADLHGDFLKQITLTLASKRALVGAPMRIHFEELVLKPSRKLPVDKPVVIIIDALDESYDEQVLKILRDEVPKLPGTFRVLVTSRMTEAFIGVLSQKAHIHSRSIDIHDQTNLDDICIFVQHVLKEVAQQRKLGENWPDRPLLDEFTRKAEGLFLWVATIARYLCRAINPDKMLRDLLSKHSPTGLSAELKMDEIYSTIIRACDWDVDDFEEGYVLVVGAILAAKTPLSMSALQSLHRSTPTLLINEIVPRLGSLLTGFTDENRPVQVLHLSLRDFLVNRSKSSQDAKRFYICEKEQSQRLATLCLTVLNGDLTQETPGVGYLTGTSPGIPQSVIVDGTISEELWYACTFWMDHITDVETPVPNGLIELLRGFVSTQLIFWIEVVTLKAKFTNLVKVRKWVQSVLEADIDLVSAIFNPSLGMALVGISARLTYMNRLEEALLAIEEAVELYRQLAADNPAAFNPELAMSLNNFSIRLFEAGRRKDAMFAIEEAIKLRRLLAADCPATFNPDLATSLNALSIVLPEVGRREEALLAIEETVALRRQLAADCPAAFNPDLAKSLHNLSVRLSAAGRTEDALVASEEATQLCRQLAADCPDAFIPNLANYLNTLSNVLRRVGRKEEALFVIEEAVAFCQRLVADRPAVFNPDLARYLGSLSIQLSALGRTEDALPPIEEAVERYRQLAADHPAAYNPEFAVSLGNFSIHLFDAGRREDALLAGEEAVALQRQLAADLPDAFSPNLVKSLNSLSNYLSQLGRPEDALVAIKEAVELYRQLAADHPTVINPDLAVCLNTFSRCLSGVGRYEDALCAIEEAVGFYRRLAADRPSAFNHDLAVTLITLSNCLQDVGRREDGLCVIKEALELYRQLASDLPAAFNPDVANASITSHFIFPTGRML